MKKSNLLLFIGAILALGTFSCGDDDDPKIPMPVELITNLSYTLTSSTGEVVTFSFLDLDGDGGVEPDITNANVSANETYTGSISLLDATVMPPLDIAEEVREEDLDHQFFFESDLPGLNVTYADEDSEGNPLGLATTLTTGDVGIGTLTITLRHEPNKGAEGVSDGNKDNAGGETDIEVEFTVRVE